MRAIRQRLEQLEKKFKLAAFRKEHQLKHKCGGWAWKDGNYCIRCGGKLK